MLDTLTRLGDTGLSYHSLDRLAAAGLPDPARLPMTVKVLLEGLVRAHAAGDATAESIAALAAWPATPPGGVDLPYRPSRVLMQDFTGVPAVVDLAAMRSAIERAGLDPNLIDPLAPADLVIDHSVQVDSYGNNESYQRNIEKEFERNFERYALLRWAQNAFHNFTVVPPGMGICHQVNLERLARVVQVREVGGVKVALPDTLVGTDSHTTMVNGLGVLGWGVGGIEAEAALLGQPIFLGSPVVVGVQFHGSLPAGATATDLVLTLTQMLRRHGVVNKFVEFCGTGLSSLSVADRATLSNMCPEYGATAALFPVDQQSLRYLEMTGREPEHIAMVEEYCRVQGLFRTDQAPIPAFSETLELDLTTVEPSVAGPKRPQDRVPLGGVRKSFFLASAAPAPARTTVGELGRFEAEGGQPDDITAHARTRGEADEPIGDGAVVIAAITSCTNTSNPMVMIAAGLVARKAVERGLTVPAYVKTSLAPGSRVVTDYLLKADLARDLETLGFYTVGYGCTTCIGNSGPLATPEVEASVKNHNLNVAAVLSGNRNFEGRIHPLVRSSYLASPPLVVAFALAGTVDIDLTSEPIGTDLDGKPVHLADIWPTTEEVGQLVEECVQREMYEKEYARIFAGDEYWQRMDAPTGATFRWDPKSTYVREPPYFLGAPKVGGPADIRDARVLVMVGDSVTTDHISPAGSIPIDSPAGRYLVEQGVPWTEFNSYGARRGNHEVMIRGTFGNIRLKNVLADGKEGYWTVVLPEGSPATIFDAATEYQRRGTPVIVLAGKEYGSGSSRDWAGKGPRLQGVKAVIAESFERIHRSNLVQMGVLPLVFPAGQSPSTLGLDGHERYDISGVEKGITPGQQVQVRAVHPDGEVTEFDCTLRVDNQTEVEYLRHDGILPMVLQKIIAEHSPKVAAAPA